MTKKSKFTRLGLGLAVPGVLFTAGCESEQASAASGGPAGYPYRIVTTVGMVADVARELAGPRADVTGIIGEGVDPHLYKPTSTDVKRLQSADVVFYNGLRLEGKMGDVLVSVARRGRPVFAVTETIAEQGDYVIVDSESHHDPHVWMDVRGWMKGVEVIERALSQFDPDNAGEYSDRADAYLEQLEKLDDYARRSLASIPEGQRVLVTAHDAFGYMARAYGIEVRGIQGLSTESEAGVRDIEELVAFLVERKIPAVFVESSVSHRNVRALIEGARAKDHDLVIGGELFSDAMGKAGSYEGTYIGMIDHNVTTITRALGGEAPERGLNGKLSH
ncbi:metal ABC transporter solute-binding protein, Zn/Mn family [Haloferula sp. A504]|uniref:metal ABC transporter solute-binding protein, Zn/Mn family n=1 Tax=Haloferula sp. A504 TaxID=3373601 RepID=UPI0031C8B135|nr:zinc ABC transporter substrate-binding protein [Verrucomicrobiaceae bacterium E54]